MRLSLTGRCISQPNDSVRKLDFETQVRKEHVQSIQFPPDGVNMGTNTWTLQPEVHTTCPANSSSPYFFCPKEIVIPADGKGVQIDVT